VSRGAAHAAIAAVTFSLAACGTQQFAPRTETGIPSPPRSSASAVATASAPSATPSANNSDATAAPSAASTSAASASSVPAGSSSAAAKAPARKYVIARHILIQWMGCKAADAKIVRTKEQAHAVAEEVLRRLKAGEEFTRVVLDYSDEPNAGRRGGSLPPFGRGTMDKQFETVAFALTPGELSGIVETPFGFHVIQRLE
jgi:NIMA-interacting peptidyl-prolyl cis-trans isomerase 1